MSNTPAPTKWNVNPREAALIYFAAVIVIWLAKWNPPATSPPIINTAIWVVGLVALVAQYELQYITQPTIPQTHAALFSSLALILSIVAGQISASAGQLWWSGAALAVIGGILAAYAQAGGVTPPIPAKLA